MQQHQQNCNILLLCLCLLAAGHHVKSEIATDDAGTGPTNSEVLAKNKITGKKEEAQPVAAVSTTPKERSTPPADIQSYDDGPIKQNISHLEKRQKQQDLLFKQLFEDLAFIKRTLIKIVNQNPDWTVILRRQDGSEDFYRTWDEYKEGFGDPQGEFFVGLDSLNEMTSDAQELLIILEDFENRTRYAKYDKFIVAGEDEKYAITELGEYSGDAGDSLSYHRGRKFSTKDQDNDNNPNANCAKDYKGGWWFDNCYSSHLTGPYLRGARSCRGGINWYQWHNYMYSLKFVEMLVRPAPAEDEG